MARRKVTDARSGVDRWTMVALIVVGASLIVTIVVVVGMQLTTATG